jgi:predicted enzyme related to lactoylglutathione lyase
MPRVIHFEILADDPQRAVQFYQSTLGWQIDKWDGPQDYWLVTTGEKDQSGIDGAIMKRNNPQASVYNTVDVPSLDEYVRKVEAAGGHIVLPKMAVAGIGWLAYCADTEGNIFGMMQNDPNAK